LLNPSSLSSSLPIPKIFVLLNPSSLSFLPIPKIFVPFLDLVAEGRVAVAGVDFFLGGGILGFHPARARMCEVTLPTARGFAWGRGALLGWATMLHASTNPRWRGVTPVHVTAL
jgi:hypothetical protein